MSEIVLSSLGNSLEVLLSAQEIVPGDAPSYQLCKTILAFHPLGAKMADSPIKMAQSQKRKITIQKGPEEKLREAFEAEWEAIGANKHILNTARLARAYGVSSIALLSKGTPATQPVKYEGLYDQTIAFNVFDPLNTAGSLVLNQDPNAMDFQKVNGITVSGQQYHRSRSVTLLHEEPLYIEYTSSSFGYVGRSVYQRALYPLKSFVQTMITDDMVSVKAGVLIAKMKQPGSIIDRLMASVAGAKRGMIKDARTGNVISIDLEEDIQSLDLKNIDAAFIAARKNILDNIATAADMPAVVLNQETFAEGFGEGTEDAKRVAAYIGTIREWMGPLYAFFDQIVMYRAWNPQFYETIKNEFPDPYAKLTYKQAFYMWKNSFSTEWPNLLEEPDSEKIQVDDVKLKGIIAWVQVLAPMLDPENKAHLIQWAQDNFNSFKLLFSSQLNLDFDALEAFVPETAQEPETAPPFSARDSMRNYDEAVAPFRRKDVKRG